MACECEGKAHTHARTTQILHKINTHTHTHTHTRARQRAHHETCEFYVNLCVCACCSEVIAPTAECVNLPEPRCEDGGPIACIAPNLDGARTFLPSHLKPTALHTPRHHRRDGAREYDSEPNCKDGAAASAPDCKDGAAASAPTGRR